MAVYRAMRGHSVALIASVTLMSTACGLWEEPESARQERLANPSRPGWVSTAVGGLDLVQVRIERPAETVAPAGGAAALFLTIVNRRASDDVLHAVSSVDAQRVQLLNGDPDASPTDGARVDLPIPGSGTVSLQHPDGPHLVLTGLKRDVAEGQFVPVTFRFEDAGLVTMNVFVQVVDRPVVPSPTG